jgi:O-antigen ligase
MATGEHLLAPAAGREAQKVRSRRKGVAAPAVEALAMGLLIVIVLWAPLPYGSNRPWSWSVLAVAVALLLVLVGLARAMDREQQRLPGAVVAAGVSTAIVWGWACLQAMPAAGPTAWIQPHWFWGEAAGAGLEVVPAPGLGAEAGRDALMRLVAYDGIFWAAFLLLGQPVRARRVLAIFLAAATVYAAYGLVNHFAGWQTVLWEQEPKPYAGFVTSTFINRNSFATYANLAILAGLVLLVEPFLRAGSLGDLRRIAVEVAEKLLAKRGPLLLALVLLVTAMLLTGSRGGFLSLAVACLVMTLLVLGVARARVRLLLPAVAVAGLLGWALVWVSGAGTLERLDQTDETLASRTLIYEDTLAMIADRPWTGHGYGTYEQSFRLYQDRSVGPWLVDKAHDTYLEHAAELGVPATLLLYLGPVILFLFCLRGAFVRRKDKIFPLLAVSATVLVAVHALVDFSLQIPAVAVAYAVILGMGVAQSVPSPQARGPGASLRD